MIDPLTMFAAVIPLVTDLGKGAIARWINPEAKPANVDEVIKLRQSEIDRLRALAELDKASGGASQWVNNVRDIQRPFAVAASVLMFAGCLIASAPDNYLELTANLAASAMFYLFGDRTLMYSKRKG